MEIWVCACAYAHTRACYQVLTHWKCVKLQLVLTSYDGNNETYITTKNTHYSNLTQGATVKNCSTKKKKKKTDRPAQLSRSVLLGKLHSKIISSDLIRFFSVKSNGEGLRSKFEPEDGQTDSEKKKRHTRALVTSVVPPHNNARSQSDSKRSWSGGIPS